LVSAAYSNFQSDGIPVFCFARATSPPAPCHGLSGCDLGDQDRILKASADWSFQSACSTFRGHLPHLLSFWLPLPRLPSTRSKSMLKIELASHGRGMGLSAAGEVVLLQNS
jgi:hypothetical protein